MSYLQISSLVVQGAPITLIATNRKAAAIVAIALPVLVLSVLLIGFVEHDFAPEAILRHTGLAAIFAPGLLTLVWWVRRYWSSAFYALKFEGPAIAIIDNSVTFFGATQPLKPTLILEACKGKVRLLDGGTLVAQRPLFFITSEQLKINLHNLSQ